MEQENEGVSMSSVIRSTGLGSLCVLSIAPLIASCATAEMATTTPSVDSTAPQSEEAAPTMDAADQMVPGDMTSGATWKDGTYQSRGGYQSPNGPETVDVTITLANNVITAIVVTPNATNSSSARYQGQFAEGISSPETLGKPLDTLSVSRVSGSSLTSGGFMEALEAIKADASS